MASLASSRYLGLDQQEGSVAADCRTCRFSLSRPINGLETKLPSSYHNYVMLVRLLGSEQLSSVLCGVDMGTRIRSQARVATELCGSNQVLAVRAPRKLLRS